MEVVGAHHEGLHCALGGAVLGCVWAAVGLLALGLDQLLRVVLGDTQRFVVLAAGDVWRVQRLRVAALRVAGRALSATRIGVLLQLGALVLEPDLHLRLRQAQTGGQGGPIWQVEVLRLAKLAVQTAQLFARVDGARLARLLALGQRHASGRPSTCACSTSGRLPIGGQRVALACGLG